ncbi:MAG: flagellar export protein FliJ [Nitrospiraceae bacterium]
MNLSVLVSYRTQLEEIHRLEFAAAGRNLHEAADRWSALEDELKAKQASYAEAGRTGLTIDETYQWYAEIEAAAHALECAAEQQAVLQEEWTQKQTTVLEAMQERKKLDILLRRRREGQQRLEIQYDQRLTDDTAMRIRRATKSPLSRRPISSSHHRPGNT